MSHQAVTQTIVVPSSGMNPHKAADRTALFNPDGTPFTAGGGAIVLSDIAYADQGQSHATALSSAVQYPEARSVSELDETKVIREYFHPDAEADTGNSGGLKIQNFTSKFGYGLITSTSYLRLYIPQNAQTAGFPLSEFGISIDFFVVSPNWNAVTGELYQESRLYSPTTDTNMLLNAAYTTSVYVGPSFEDSTIAWVHYVVNHNLGSVSKYRTLQNSVVFIPSE